MPKLNTTDFHLPYASHLVSRARKLRQNPTPAEKKLWQDYLKTFPFRVLRQRPIDYFIVDFYCAALKLVIEVDGESHFTDEGKMRDAERTQILESYGLTVLRITNDEVMNQFEGVCRQIGEQIPLNPPSKGGLRVAQFSLVDGALLMLVIALTDFEWPGSPLFQGGLGGISIRSRSVETVDFM